jgi:hypothetical protein
MIASNPGPMALGAEAFAGDRVMAQAQPLSIASVLCLTPALRLHRVF